MVLVRIELVKRRRLILKVPLGTQVYEEDNKTLLFDFTKIGEKFTAASGGKEVLNTI